MKTLQNKNLFLDANDLAIVKKILQNEVPDYEVWAFGSRVAGKAQKYSDLDLVLVGKGVIDFRKIERLKDAFAISDLTCMVDVLDWHAISDNFKKIIKQNYFVLQEAK